MMPGETHTFASAHPTKSFFVNMITRDITLEDCILDLIDNSVDSAWHGEGGKRGGLNRDVDLSKYVIRVTIGENFFAIIDNCGGMSLTAARDHAFSFGRDSHYGESESYSIGVYGIGMKRAVFKLGRKIRVESLFTAPDDRRERFEIPIDVDQWLGDTSPEWKFAINILDDVKGEPGVTTVIEKLTPAARTAFSTTKFSEDLRRIIERDYSLHLARGLQILINEKVAVGWSIRLRQSDDFRPVRETYLDEVDEKPVQIDIIAGMMSAPTDSDPIDEKANDRRYGWYVACNDRIVLAADKTSISGWGSFEWPLWHNQYSGFLGIILFNAADASALPMTTTKRSVDISSDVYKRAQQRMRVISKSWIDYTNDRKQALDEARQKEEATQAVSVYEVANRDRLAVPRLTARGVEPVSNISYSVAFTKASELKTAFENPNMSNREVGQRSFDFAHKRLVED